MHLENKAQHWFVYILLIGITLFFLPVTISGFVATKSVLFFGLTFILFFLWIISRLRSDAVSIPYNLPTLALLLIPTTYLLSGLFSGNISDSIWGNVFSSSTVVFVATFTVVILVIARIMTTASIYRSILVFFGIAGVLILVQSLLLVGLPQLGYFFDKTVSTIGSWNDLGLFLGSVIVLMLVAFESKAIPRNKKIRIPIIALFVLSFVMLALINFTFVWYLVGIFSLIIFVFILAKQKQASQKIFPTLSLVIFLISFVFILGQGTLGQVASNALNISSSEVRPSWVTTSEVFMGVMKTDPVFGVGANQFVDAWNMHKPVSVNFSIFWDTQFTQAIGYVPTFAITGGILSLLAWLFFIGMFLIVGFKTIFIPTQDRIEGVVSFASFMFALYGLVGIIFYSPSIPFIVITAVALGMFFSRAYHHGVLKEKTINLIQNSRAGFIYIFLLVILLVGLIGAGYTVGQKYVSAVYYQQGLVALNEGNQSEGAGYIVKSINLNPRDESLRLLAQINTQEMIRIMNQSGVSEETTRQQFQETLTLAIQQAQAAIAADPKNSLNYLLLGQIYQTLSTLEIEGAYQGSLNAYREAQKYNPKNPFIELQIARLEVGVGNMDAAQEAIGKALELKGNYTEAIFLLSQINVTEGNTEQAIANVTAATQIAPNDPLVFFQLGLLYYSIDDFKNAIGAFEQAVRLNQYYANAKYFLGLSYEFDDRYEDAIAQFEDLVLLNPDNKEVELILSNLKSGLGPFAGAEDQEIDDEPESRDELPLEETEESQEIFEIES